MSHHLDDILHLDLLFKRFIIIFRNQNIVFGALKHAFIFEK